MRPASVEELVFPGLNRDRSLRLEQRLEAAAEGGGVFGGSLAEVEVHVSWSLGKGGTTRWMRASDGRMAAHVWIDLLAPENLSGQGERPLEATESAAAIEQLYMEAFRAGFLHQLGRVLYSPSPAVGDVHPLENALRPGHPEARRMPREIRQRLGEWEMRSALEGILDYLEGARTDMLLLRRFRGAAGRLEGRVRQARESFGPRDLICAAVAVGWLGIRGRAADILRAGGSSGPWETAFRAGDADDTETEVVGRRFAEEVLGVLGDRVDDVHAATGKEGAYLLADLVVYRLAPLLIGLRAEMTEEGMKSFLGSGGWELFEKAMSVGGRGKQVEEGKLGLRFFAERSSEMEAGEPGPLVDTRSVRLPHVDGGLVAVRVEHARAVDLIPDDITRAVLREVRETYGEEARAAFQKEAGPLRRALAVNYERRHRGRYRTGKHIGISNLRQYVLGEDIRLFQRLQVPAELSYYFHLLVDVSYSMLEGHNMQKALATAHAFTELLVTFGVPVDVTLYSSGITDLFDHRTDLLSEYFGGEFGFLVSGTLEMEALAYAKARADRVDEEHKVLVVLTDGTPVGLSLPAVGATDLTTYYRDTFLPWFRRSRVDVIALGLGVRPSYHTRVVVLDQGWDALPFFLALIEEMIAEQTQASRALWL